MLEAVELLKILRQCRHASKQGRISRSGASTGRSRQMEFALAPASRYSDIHMWALEHKFIR